MQEYVSMFDAYVYDVYVSFFQILSIKFRAFRKHVADIWIQKSYKIYTEE